jgi:hypothetical protein
MKRRTSSEWQKIIQTQQESGLSISKFCKTQGLNVSTFHLNRKKLSTSKSSFIQVARVADLPRNYILNLNTMTLEIPRGFDPESLQQIIQCIRAMNNA